MRILYHHRTLGDGAEGIHIAAIAEAFRTLGHEVRVASIIGDQTNVSTPRIQVLERFGKRMPRAVYEAMELAYSVVGHRMLMAHIRSWKPDLLYERYTLFNIAGLSAARRTKLPFVLEVNAPLAYERAKYESLALGRMARRCERYVCSRAMLSVAVSSPLKDYLVENGADADRVVVIPNGVDPEVFRPDPAARRRIRARLGVPRAAVVVGFSGILRPWHGAELLLEAVRRVPRTEEDVRLLILGDGPSRSVLERRATELGLQHIVYCPGRVPHSEVPHYLAAIDVGVSPRATFYASPMKIPEYMATGMAVVAPRMANLQDLIADGSDGVLFEPEDAADLARVLSMLIRDPELRRRLGESARSGVVARRTWRHNAAEILGRLCKN